MAATQKNTCTLVSFIDRFKKAAAEAARLPALPTSPRRLPKKPKNIIRVVRAKTEKHML